ncbi:hypothetical protein EV177_010946, partial [Coemansia sp. RSA 1804]
VVHVCGAPGVPGRRRRNRGVDCGAGCWQPHVGPQPRAGGRRTVRGAVPGRGRGAHDWREAGGGRALPVGCVSGGAADGGSGHSVHAGAGGRQAGSVERAGSAARDAVRLCRLAASVRRSHHGDDGADVWRQRARMELGHRGVPDRVRRRVHRRVPR